MARNLPDDIPDSAFDEAPDYLKDKPEGFCPWCDAELGTTSLDEDDDITIMDDIPFCPCGEWDFWADEEGNRKRYSEQAELAAKREERINRELARHGE